MADIDELMREYDEERAHHRTSQSNDDYFGMSSAGTNDYTVPSDNDDDAYSPDSIEDADGTTYTRRKHSKDEFLSDDDEPPMPTKFSISGILAAILGIAGMMVASSPFPGTSLEIGLAALVLSLFSALVVTANRRKGRMLAVIAMLFAVITMFMSFALHPSFITDIKSSLMNRSTTYMSRNFLIAGMKDRNENDGVISGAKGDIGTADIQSITVKRSDDSKDGDPTVTVTIRWTNKSGSEATFDDAVKLVAMQNGEQLDRVSSNADSNDTSHVSSGTDGSYQVIGDVSGESSDADRNTDDMVDGDNGSHMGVIGSGETGTARIVFVIGDGSPVTVEAYGANHQQGDPRIVHKFSLIG